MGEIKKLNIKLPEYQVETKPDHVALGAKIDAVIKQHFLGESIAVRCLGSQEHSAKTKDELVKIIIETGWDRYDPMIKGDRYDNLENKAIDIFALPFKVTPKIKMLERFIEPFYEWPIKEGLKPIRIDLVIIYDRAKLKAVRHSYDGKRIKRDGFVFKVKDKRDALKGIIKIR